jgi:hypothetical protein
MPIFRVTVTEEVRRTYELFVQAATQKEADNYAAGLVMPGAPHFRETAEETGRGEVADITPVETVPVSRRRGGPATDVAGERRRCPGGDLT